MLHPFERRDGLDLVYLGWLVFPGGSRNFPGFGRVLHRFWATYRNARLSTLIVYLVHLSMIYLQMICLSDMYNVGYT